MVEARNDLKISQPVLVNRGIEQLSMNWHLDSRGPIEKTTRKGT